MATILLFGLQIQKWNLLEQEGRCGYNQGLGFDMVQW